MTGSVSVRLAGALDCETLVPLVASFRDQLGQSEPAADTLGSSLRRLLADPATDILLALGADGGALGYSQLRFRYSLWVAGIEGQLDDLFVLAGARRRGVGAELLAASIRRAREREARLLGLNTNERNADALRLYRRAGFTAERPRWGAGRQLWLELQP
jgi:ribosomal protein S18 acetylase RimI-like enzyme